MSNDHVLIVVQINNTTGDTTFLRSYISGDPFKKIEEMSGKFKGFNIPSTAVYKNINDTCQSDGLSKDCITINPDDDKFPRLSNYQTEKYGFIVTTTASPEIIDMYSLDVTGEQLITSDEKEIRTIANIATYERTKITTASDGAVDGLFGFFDTSVPKALPSSSSSSASSSSSSPSSPSPSETNYVPSTTKEFSSGNPKNLQNGFIRVTEYNGLYELTNGYLNEVVHTNNQPDYNKNSKIYRFNKYDKDTVKDRDRTVEIYHVENTNIPEGSIDNGKKLWIKGNIYDQTGSKMVAKVISDEEATKENTTVANMEKTQITSASEEKQITSETKKSSAENVIRFNEEINRLLRSDSSAAAVTTIEKIQPNALSAAIKTVGDAAAAAANAISAMNAVKEEPNDLSAAIKAVGVAAAAAATAIGEMKAKPRVDLVDDASDLASSALDSLLDTFAPDNKSELSEAASAAAKAAGDAAKAVEKLKVAVAAQPNNTIEEARERNALRLDQLKRERVATSNQGIVQPPGEIEENKLQTEKQAEDERLSKIAAEKLAAEKQAEDERLAKIAAEKLAAEKQAEDERLAKNTPLDTERMVTDAMAAADLDKLSPEEKAKATIKLELLPDDMEARLESFTKVTDKYPNPLIGGLDDTENVDYLNEDVLDILKNDDKKGGAKVGDNSGLIKSADAYINSFKSDTYKFLKNSVFLKLTSLNIDQLSDLFLRTPIVNPNLDGQVTFESEDKKKMLLAIAQFLYSDLTFYVLFNKNIQELLFGETFNKYCDHPTTSNNRNNYLKLLEHVLGLEKSRETAKSNMYNKFGDLIGLKNTTILNYWRVQSTKMGLQTMADDEIKKLFYSYSPTEIYDEERKTQSIRINELTLYIKDFLELLTRFQEKIQDTLYDDQREMSEKELPLGTYDMYNILIPYIHYKKQQLEQLEAIVLPVVKRNEQTLIDNINKKITENSSKNIITYLKLRNDDDDKRIYNERFDIKIHRANRSLMVRYRNDNFKFYNDKQENQGYTNPPLPDVFIPVDGNVKVKKYDYQYLFGKFTDIFIPKDDNADIAVKMNTIYEKILGQFNNGKYELEPAPVFMLGYGASGAGKTSSLIYYNKGSDQQKKDGILVHLCNKLLATVYKKIQICSREFYHVNPKDKSMLKGLDEPEVVKVPSGDGYITFENNESKGFVLADNYVHENHHQYKGLKKRTNGDKGHKDYIAICTDAGYKYYEYNGNIEESYADKPETLFPDNKIPTYPVGIALVKVYIFKKGTSLGAVAIHLIDTDRFVKATTNNPNSSRSHTLIFVKLIPDADSGRLPGNIIIGDFAGVENAFACTDTSTIGKFLNIKRDDKSKSLYYSTERLGDNVDPVGKIFGGAGAECDKFNALLYSSYIFENPVVRKGWPKHIVEYYAVGEKFGDLIEFAPKDNNLLKSAISIILEWIKNTQNKEAGSGTFLEDLKTSLMSDVSDMRSNALKAIDTAALKWRTAKSSAQSKMEQLQTSAAKFDETKKVLDTETEKIKTIILKLKEDKGKGKMGVDLDNDISTFQSKISIIKYELSKLDVIKIIVIGKLNKYYKNLYIKNKFLVELKEVKNNHKESIATQTAVQTIDTLYKGGTTVRNVKIPSYQTVFDNLLSSSLFDKDGKQLLIDSRLNPPYQSLPLVLEDVDILLSANKIIIDALQKKLDVNIKLAESNNANISSNTKTIYEIKAIIDGKDDWDDKIKDRIKKTKKKFGDTIQSEPDKEKWFGEKLQHATGLYDLIKTILEEKGCREGNASVICENRTEEGKFINDSLSKVRDVISKVLYEKNKTAISISPDYIDECLTKYCLSSEGCFNFEKPKDTKSPDKTGSVIFDEIYNVLSQGDGAGVKKYATVQDLYKDIIVSVFCVFNISRGANNPPPVPYMDINDLKRIFFSGISTKEDYDTFKELGTKITKMIEMPCDPNTFKPKDGFNDKVGDLMNTPQILDSVKEDYLSGANKTIFGEFKHILTRDWVSVEENYTSNLLLKERIKRFIQMVDKSNAVSAIGTLEFLDNISKYNAVQTICNSSTDDEFAEVESKYSEILYPTKSVAKKKGGNTKRHKTKPKKNQTTTLKSYSRR
jgi:hypothetical protein